MRAAERAYTSVREGILCGTYAAGSRLTEADLAQAAGVSRTPIHEALQRLPGYLMRIGELNDGFHRAVQRAADSPRLAKYAPAELQRSADQHLELVQAIEARDGTWAHSVMRAHILAGRATYLRGRRGA